MPRVIQGGPVFDRKPGGFYVYLLRAPDSPDVRYVGYTNSPRLRWSLHLSNAKRDAKLGRPSALARWLLDLASRGERPVMEVIERPEGDRAHAEKREAHWIRRYKNRGAPLFNVEALPPAPHRCRKCGEEGHKQSTCGRKSTWRGRRVAPAPRCRPLRQHEGGASPARRAVLAIRAARQEVSR